MDGSIVILVLLALVAVVLAWRLRRASVERIVPPWEARSGRTGASEQAEADDVIPTVMDTGGGQTSPPAADEEQPTRSAFVTVLAVQDYAELLVAKSLLEGAEIPYYAKGEIVQNVFGAHLWGWPNVAMGPVEIQVPAAFEEEARTLLENPEPLDE